MTQIAQASQPVQVTRRQMPLPRETVYIPNDSGLGGLYRPFARGDAGGRLSTLETLWDFFIDDVPDPDEALRLNPEFLQQLHMHWDVQAAMRKREFTVSAMPDSVDPNPDAPDKSVAEQVAKYCQWAWNQLPDRFKLYEMMQYAVLSGGVGVEFDWHREVTGVERPVHYHVVDKSRFLFDRRGNMCLRTRDYPVWGVRIPQAEASRYVKQYPLGKFIYHTHRRQPGTWDRPELEGYMYYGMGEDVTLYYPVTFDNFVMRFRMKWLEKFGIPPTVLYHLDNEDPSRIRQIADSLRGESIITIPKGMGGKDEDGANMFFKLEQLAVPTMTNDAFANFSKEWTKPKIDQILLGSAEEQQKGESGGYADHVSRNDSGPQVWFKRDARNIAETITTQILPAIARGRYPNLPAQYLPVFKIEPKEERDRAQEMEIASKAAAMVPLVEDEVYERSGFRKPKPDEKTVFLGGGGMGGAGDPFGMGLDTGGGPGGPPGGDRPGADDDGDDDQGGPARGKFGGGGAGLRKPIGGTGGRGSAGVNFNPLTSRGT